MDKAAQSLLELLLQIPGLEIQIMPGLRPNVGLRAEDPRAKKLMAVWDDVASKVADKKFRRPTTISQRDAIDLEAAGYVKQHGDDLVITQKGSDLIKIMLLNDDSHTFEKQALYTLGPRVRSGTIEYPMLDTSQKIKRASVEAPKPKNWYKRMRSKDYE